MPGEAGTEASGRSEAPEVEIREGEGLRARNKREKEERILAAARTLFSERGFEATTTRDIAERAGIGTGTLFLYVRSKEELLLRLFADELERVQGQLFQSLPREEPLVDQLMAIFGGLFDLYSENPALSRTYIRELLFLEPEQAEEHQGVVDGLLARLAGLLEAAQAHGEVDKELNLTQAAVNAYSLYLTTLVAWLGGRATSQKAHRHSLREGLELQLRGLVPAGRKRSAPARTEKRTKNEKARSGERAFPFQRAGRSSLPRPRSACPAGGPWPRAPWRPAARPARWSAGWRCTRTSTCPR